ncbi:MAG TPA: acyl-CoA dehydrogenase [Candidimonas sp.]|nr:acyl-CoA dehydrogenase [Candidimonas sp.]
MDNLFSDAVERLFAQSVTPSVIRAIEAGGSPDELWQAFEASGFLDVLIPEEHDGAGLALSDAFSLLMFAGQYAVPLPFAHTMLARAWLSGAGVAIPPGAIVIAGSPIVRNGTELDSDAVPFGRVADWLLADSETGAILLPVTAAQRQPCAHHGSVAASLHWDACPPNAVSINYAAPSGASLTQIAAAGYATLLAGAAARVLELTLDYANQRNQFGKPIGKFQAVQNQISVMAERAWAARMAAQLACQGTGPFPRPLLAAVGKSTASEASCLIADIGHAVHGAIGVTEEYDLQLYTRRLREWRLAAGSESYWASHIGSALLSKKGESALAFICNDLSAPCDMAG